MTRLLPLALWLAAAPGPDSTLVPQLPLVEARPANAGRTLAVIWSGDGNWAAFVHRLADALNARGVAVVGLKSRAYLTAQPAKTPDLAGKDLERLLRAYLGAWSVDTVLLVGYSRGADLLPFAVSRLPDELRRQVRLLALISPSVNASFAFHWNDIISNPHRASDLAVLPEVRKLQGLPMLCIYGTEDRDALCPAAEPGLLEAVAKNGGHRRGDPAEIAGLLIDALAAPNLPTLQSRP
jgi:type IV secretory pathway VirJ component